MAEAPSLSQQRSLFKVESIRVLTGRIICEIVLTDPQWRYSTPELMQALCTTLPDLPYHVCVNSEGRLFSAVMDHTSLAHVLEHVTISLQVRATNDKTASFQGTTEWLDEAEGRARVQVGFKDDLVALRSFNDAIALIDNAALELC